ncbi:MAG TPA: DUF899 domain-containing protein [Solirubrobacteraceae bacterium]|nr:DUF899 domain-containing protein [Solirubrobacteraceae bacterium]
MTEPRTGTRAEWLAARRELLEREKELTRRSDELARERAALPWVALDKPYTFETAEGTRTLAELFDGRSQLLVYHFMFAPEWDEGCPSCSSFTDGIDGTAAHLNAHDVTLTLVSRAPVEKLLGYRERMGWSLPWASSGDGDFNFDFGVSFTDEQQREGAEYNFRHTTSLYTDLPGTSAFALRDGVVHHTYSCYARGGDVLWTQYQLLDRAPVGRNEGSPPDPWIRRHDQYDPAPAAASA